MGGSFFIWLSPACFSGDWSATWRLLIFLLPGFAFKPEESFFSSGSFGTSFFRCK